MCLREIMFPRVNFPLPNPRAISGGRGRWRKKAARSCQLGFAAWLELEEGRDALWTYPSYPRWGTGVLCSTPTLQLRPGKGNTLAARCCSLPPLCFAQPELEVGHGMEPPHLTDLAQLPPVSQLWWGCEAGSSVTTPVPTAPVRLLTLSGSLVLLPPYASSFSSLHLQPQNWGGGEGRAGKRGDSAASSESAELE